MFYDDARKEMQCVTLSMLNEKSEQRHYGEKENIMSPQEKKILQKICGKDAKLPFPCRRLCTRIGPPTTEYIIPEHRKLEILNKLYPFEPCPGLDDWRFDLHEGKMFCVREFRVIWENGFNYLVSPYYPRSGGMVIDWLECESDSSPLWVKGSGQDF